MMPHRAPRVVRVAGLTNPAGFVPVDLGSFESSVPGVYAIGDVAGIRIPDGRPHPKAGVFAESQGHAVAEQIAARIEGREPEAYSGVGFCFIDTGHGEAAAGEVDVLASGGPVVRLNPPSSDSLELKAEFERDRFRRWFGG